MQVGLWDLIQSGLINRETGEAMLRPITEFLPRLNKVRAVRDSEWTACCPAHDDKTPSLSIKELGDGRVLLHCFAGCTGDDILAAVGMSWAEIMPDELTRQPGRGFPLRTSELDKHIERVAGYLCDVDHEKLVVDLWRLMKKQGTTPTPEDNARAKQALQALARNKGKSDNKRAL